MGGYSRSARQGVRVGESAGRRQASRYDPIELARKPHGVRCLLLYQRGAYATSRAHTHAHPRTHTKTHTNTHTHKHTHVVTHRQTFAHTDTLPVHFHSYAPILRTTQGGTMALFQAFEKPVADRLIFAGEHTSAAFRGTTHGAFESGTCAAHIDILWKIIDYPV